MNTETRKPVLVYDGDCGICRYWVDYWQGYTEERVDYQPYQEVAARYPDVSLQEFRNSIQFFTGDKKYSGAEAVYVLLQSHFPYNVYLWLYRHLPGFGFIAEWFYNFFSQYRGLLKTTSYLLWGRKHEPARYDLVRWWFLRLLGLMYLSAFSSLSIQITGLVGKDGILPVTSYLHQLLEYYGPSAYLRVPTLLWISDTDSFLTGCCIAGIIFSLCLVFNFLTRISVILLFILWLSLFYAGQVFLQYQWDSLLLECGFLAIFLPTRSVIVVWLYRWLAFRFMFMGGIVKIASGDPTWDHLTALTYHFETQPLPNTLAWYAHHLPVSFLMFLTGATLFIELLLPFLIFLTRNFRFVAAFGFILLQTSILLTGNYNYFNLLTLSFCLFLFDDAAIRWTLPVKRRDRILAKYSVKQVSRTGFTLSLLLAFVMISASSAQLWYYFNRTTLPLITIVARYVSPLNIVNIYGPFSVMTTVRNEIIIEGSNDEKYWKEYKFKYKPDDLDKRPQWIIPHQPRLDWQMWFAALAPVEQSPWYSNLIYRLLQNSAPVTALLARNPFPEAPPKYIRSLLYEYHFSNASQLQDKGVWWTREFTAMYQLPASLPEQ